VESNVAVQCHLGTSISSLLSMDLLQQVGDLHFMVSDYYKALIHASNKKSPKDAFDLCWCSNAYASQPHSLDGTGNVAHHTTT
jgi:hypothetical protein